MTHGGEVSAENAEGGGALFRIHLPAMRETESEPD